MAKVEAIARRALLCHLALDDLAKRKGKSLLSYLSANDHGATLTLSIGELQVTANRGSANSNEPRANDILRMLLCEKATIEWCGLFAV